MLWILYDSSISELELTTALLQCFLPFLNPTMSQVGSVRKRKDASAPVKAKDTSSAAIDTVELDKLARTNAAKAPAVEWDYRIALAVLTVLAFVTRFWGIGHPDEVVFDEVHFGKVAIPICAQIDN